MDLFQFICLLFKANNVLTTFNETKFFNNFQFELIKNKKNNKIKYSNFEHIRVFINFFCFSAIFSINFLGVFLLSLFFFVSLGISA